MAITIYVRAAMGEIAAKPNRAGGPIMIDEKIVGGIRVSTCAVVRMDKTHEELHEELQSGKKLDRPESIVHGTAFVVRRNIVLTNRHVVKLIADEHSSSGHFNNWYLEFVYPREPEGWATTYRRVINVFAFIDPTGRGGMDAGFLEFTPEELGLYVPVPFGALDLVRVGVDVAVCGYPLGNELLMTGPGLSRFGPVVHRGIISGVAPFEVPNPRNITAFITDLNSAGGMSGSPVFTPEDGKVIGLHYAGAAGTVGICLPIDQARVDGWVHFYERIFVKGENPSFPTITGGGDIVPE